MKKTYIIPRSLVIDLGTEGTILADSLPADIITPGVGGGAAKSMDVIDDFDIDIDFLDLTAEDDF